jgi:hypothetical protein
MQRRAAAVYFVLFMVIGAGGYAFMQVGMSAPEVDLDGPTYTEGETLTVNGVEFTVTAAEPESGEVTFFNEEAVETATLENGSTTQYDGGPYTVRTVNESDEFRLTEEQNVSAIVANDSDATGVVTDDNDQQFVRFWNGSLTPLSEYLPPAETATFAVGDEFAYAEENVTATVDTVTTSEATLVWDNPGNESIGFDEGENVTLAGQTYMGHIPANGSVEILPAEEYYGQYQAELSDIDYYQERQNGVWGIIIVSFLAAIVLVSAAYLPNK